MSRPYYGASRRGRTFEVDDMVFHMPVTRGRLPDRKRRQLRVACALGAMLLASLLVAIV